MGGRRLALVSDTTLAAAYALSAKEHNEAALIALGKVLVERIEATTDAQATVALSRELRAVLAALGWTSGRGDDGWRTFTELGGPTIRDTAQP